MGSEDHSRILRRIKKCLAMAESSNENEAAVALRQAQKLMQEHGIVMEDAQAPDIDVLDASEGKKSKGQMLEHEIYLFSTVANFFGCSFFMNNRWPVFAGEAPGPQIAEYAASTLLRQLRSTRKKTLEAIKLEVPEGSRLKSKVVREFNHSFGSAWVYAVNERIKDFAQGVVPDKSEMHQKAFFGEREVLEHTPPRRNSSKNAINSYAALKGAAYGAEAELNHGVDRSEGQLQLADAAL